MPWLDAHLDLAYLALNGRDITDEAIDPAVGCVTLPALRAGGIETVLATIFTEPDADPSAGAWTYRASDDLDGAEAAGRRQLEVYLDLEARQEISIVRWLADLRRPAPLPRVILLMEGADPIRSPAHASWWVERGVRAVGLAWAAGTRYAGGNGSGGPLTDAGRDLVAALDELGVIHDASHLSDEAFDAFSDAAKGLVVATHSNCRAIAGPSQRHLRDDQIATIGARGGIVGLNLCSQFIVSGRRPTARDCIAHVERVATIMGHRRGVGLGSDMDGGFAPKWLPKGVDDPRRLDALTAALEQAGWSPEELNGFREANWRRVIGDALA